MMVRAIFAILLALVIAIDIRLDTKMGFIAAGWNAVAFIGWFAQQWQNIKD